MDKLVTSGGTAVRLHPTDNVVVASTRLPQGTFLAGENIHAAEPIPSGHKIATTAIAAGEPVRKYGQVIGVATRDIAAGAHVHVHNLAISDLRADAEAGPTWQRREAPRSFMGFRRKDGRVGTRNYIGILTSANCSATVARHIAEAAEKSGLISRFENVDGIVPITHTGGCGMAGS